MALIAYIAPQYVDGTALKTALYRLKGVTTLDTFQTSTDFSRVIVATSINSTRSLAVITSTTPSSNTLLTFTEAAMALDDLWVLVIGSSA